MTRHRFHFDWQIWLLLMAALLSAMLAYNTPLAMFQLGLIVLGVAVYLLMANLPDPLPLRQAAPRSVLAGILAVLPVVIAAYFFLTNDWSHWIGKLSVFDPVLRVLAAWPLSTIGLGANPNVIGGIIAALLPLQVYALRHARRSLAALLIGVSAVALVLSETRGAWLALILITGMWGLWRTITRRQTNLRRARWQWLIIVAVLGIVGAALLIATPLGGWLLSLGGDRTQIWRNSLDLAGDYPLTGLGLGDFEMTYSTYALLIHVGHTIHAHNLWLDVWLNLGLLGLLALAGLVVNAVWPKPSPSPWRMAALMTLGIILVHTLVDDSIFGYGGAAIPIIFIPLGLLARSGAAPTQARSRWRPAWAIWGVAAIGLIIGLIIPPGRALLAANLGALQQTRQELAVYRWPEVPIQDTLRQTTGLDLTGAVGQYQTALAMDANNITALRHLAQIELARQQYDQACAHLTAAYAVNPGQRATRQLLGECAALAGQPDQAVALWGSLDLGQGQLSNRQYWYTDYLHDQTRGDLLRQAINVLPSNSW